MKVNIELEPKDLDEIHDVLIDWLGIDFTKSQIVELVDQEILLYMSQYGIYDTLTRESLMESIGQKIMGQKAPSNREGREQYWEHFTKRAQAIGYVVV